MSTFQFHMRRSVNEAVEFFPEVPVEVEIHCTRSPDFPKRYGRAVKAAGGRYSECRGDMDTRFVHLPCKGNGELITDIARDFGKTITSGDKGVVCMIVRKTPGTYHLPSGAVVCNVPKEGAIFDRFITEYQANIRSCAKRGVRGVFEGPVPQSFYDTQHQNKIDRLIAQRDNLKAQLARVERELAEAEAESPKEA